MGFFRAHFLAASSPLSLLLFKLALVSIGVSSVDLVFFFVFLDVGDARDADVTGVAGIVGTVGDTGVITGAGVASTAADDGGAFFCF